jgi:cephalosporin hydroxylase
MVDLVGCDAIDMLLDVCENENINATFYKEDDLTCPIEETELLFIDTWHVYGHLKREFARWHSYAKKYIILHDTTVDGEYGESIRMGWNILEQSKASGIPVEEIARGLWPAVEEFLKEHPEWVLKERYTNNNGLTVLARAV